jgi:CRISPR system Cascade subunit CasC
MKIECHILQSFPPHNLNRDDTNSPKDCEFGGVRRARISSQCLKRSVRDYFDVRGSFSAENRSVRTKRIVEQVVESLVREGRDRTTASAVVRTLLEGAKLKTEADSEESAQFKTQYLLYLPTRKVAEVAAIAEKYWDDLAPLNDASNSATEAEKANDGPKKKSVKKAAQAAEVPKEARAAVLEVLRDATSAPEVALFGRMIADKPEWNVEAACQVAHAISTHRVAMDFDFFTAIDDLKKDSESGSDMMGTIQFNSACFYRYAVLDAAALLRNLGGDEQSELCAASIRAFLEAFVMARPSGKQNSMAANTLPSTVIFSVRENGSALSLANAFEDPVVSKSRSGFIGESSSAMMNHLAKLTRMYPQRVTHLGCTTEDASQWADAGVSFHTTVTSLIDAVVAVAGGAQKAKVA